MRSIGKVKIRKLKALIVNTIEKNYPELSYREISDNIKARIPDNYYDTWESAWSEIDRIINDTICEYTHGKI